LANQIATGTYGLNTGASAAYNPWGTETQGQVNQQILNAARAQYLPTLQTIQGGVSAEDTVNPQRVSDIKAIYGDYANQATNAYNTLRGTLTQMITANQSQNQAAQQTLGAALNSANVPGQTLDEMMGITAPQGAPASPYLAAAEAQGQGINNTLQDIGTGVLGTAAGQIQNAGLERAQQLDTESLRHAAALQGFQGQMQALAQQIPGDIQTARNTITTQLQNAATTNLQNRIAEQTLALNQSNAKFTQSEQLKSDATVAANNKETAKENWAKIQAANSKAAITNQESIDKFNTNTSFKIAGLQAKQKDNILKVINAYLAPTKDEQQTYTNKIYTNVGGVQTATGSEKGQKLNEAMYYQRLDPKKLLDQIQVITGNRTDALKAMSGITTNHGTANGQTIGQWAQDQLYYEQAPGYRQQPQDVTQARQRELQTVAGQVVSQAKQLAQRAWNQFGTTGLNYSGGATPTNPGAGKVTQSKTPMPSDYYKNFMPADWQQAYNQALRTLRTNPNWRLPSVPRGNQVFGG